MKQLYRYFFTLFMLWSSICFSAAQKQAGDSLRVSLLTCSPHDALYSLYGHTAIRIENKARDADFVVNYGVFSFDKPYFALRFVFGLTDYEMGVLPYHIFLQEYAYYGSSVTEQELALTQEEKERFLAAIEDNYRPENRVYRYNFFYDNCTTRARDKIVDAIEGTVVYNDSVPEGLTFRRLVHSKTAHHPWARLGNDLLLGVGADRPLTLSEMQFLPEELLHCADSAYILLDNGEKRRLVSRKSIVLEERVREGMPSTPFTPVMVASCVLALSLAVSAIEWRKKCYMWLFDYVFISFLGICGIVIGAMLFSQHPTVRLNAQILLFNPLLLFFGHLAIRRYRSGRISFLWLVEILLLCLLLVVFSFEIQWIDPSVRLLAVSMLLRSAMKLRGIPKC